MRLLDKVSWHSDQAQMHEHLARAFRGHQQYELATYHDKLASQHKETSNTFYVLRQALYKLVNLEESAQNDVIEACATVCDQRAGESTASILATRIRDLKKLSRPVSAQLRDVLLKEDIQL